MVHLLRKPNNESRTEFFFGAGECFFKRLGTCYPFPFFLRRNRCFCLIGFFVVHVFWLERERERKREREREREREERRGDTLDVISMCALLGNRRLIRL